MMIYDELYWEPAKAGDQALDKILLVLQHKQKFYVLG
jgi:hypothetical protein